MVAEAQRVSRLTGGAFDITVGPLVDIWGFGPSGATETPDEETLRELVAVTGFEQLEVDVEGGTLRKARADCRIDLSAIAKGFAADQVSEMLVRQGPPHHMVEVGGEVRARGFNGSGQVWQIGIERPTSWVGRCSSWFRSSTFRSRLLGTIATFSSATACASPIPSIHAPVGRSPTIWLRCRSFMRVA